MYMHYSPKKLLMTLTCIDIYACNIVSPNPQVHSKTIVSTYQTYITYYTNISWKFWRQKTKDKVFKEYWNLGTQKRHQKELT